MSKKRLPPNAIVIAYLARGIPAVQELDEKYNLSVRQVKDALKSIEKKGADISNLEEWLFNVKGASYKKRSRRSVVAGTVRAYKAGAHGDKGRTVPYVKIPVSPLGVAVGASIKVTFDADKITVERP